MNAALMQLIRAFEGLRLRPYLCPAGVPTIGYGHTGPDVSMSMAPITEAKAEEMAGRDAAVAISAATKLCPTVAGHAGRTAAIADFAFNLGATRLAGSTLRRRLAARDWDGASTELRKWVRAGTRVLPGLVARRAAERSLLVGGSA